MNMLHEVIAGLPEGRVKEFHFGDHWTAVVADVDGTLQCGLASNPGHSDTFSLETQRELVELARTQPAGNFCDLAFRQDMRLVSVGVATINALLPVQPERWDNTNAEQVIARQGAGKRVALVGHFPFVPELRQQIAHLDVLELHPQLGDHSADEAPQIVPEADVVAITSMTLINGTLDELLELCSPQAYVMLLGPTTPLSPVLFDYGIDMLCGSVVENIKPVLQAIDEGKRFRQFKPLGVRLVNLARRTDGS
jgi:uncharacterized protein (DUF4213/DUF364 family)